MSDVVVRDAEAASRYEALIDGELAGVLEYRRNASDALLLIHTEVLPEFEGQGVASKLVHEVLADIRARGLKLEPLCPYVVAYIKRHPDEAAGLLATRAT